MRLPSRLTLPMIDHLEDIYFNRVWNATKDHGEVNFSLTKAAVRVQAGAVPVSLSVVGLPTTDKVYAVYHAPIDVFGRFVTLPSYHWINQANVLKQESIRITAYTAQGRMIPERSIFLRYDPSRSMVLIAINTVYTKACTSLLYPDLYMSVYKDTSRMTPIVSSLYQVKTSAPVLAAISEAQSIYPAGTIVTINGWTIDPNKAFALTTGDVVEIMSDPDIVGYADLYLDDNQTGYFSSKFGEYREILHLPKSINPNNYIITHDTLTINVFDALSNKGVYGHRVDPHAIEAITHQDFSMSRSVLNAFQNGLGAQSVKVRLHVRYATIPLRLSDDINHLQSLYVLSDEIIKKQLVGLSDHPIKEWKAAYLEQSAFLDLVYRFPDFDQDILANYSNAVGYYDVASTLSQAMHYYSYKGEKAIIAKPKRLIGYPCQALVYAKGRKLPAYSVKVEDYSTQSVSIDYTNTSYITINTPMAAYITEGGLRTPIPFNPTSLAASITLDSDDYSVVKIVDYPSPQPIWQDSTVKGYHVLPVSPGDYHLTVKPDNSVVLSVNPSHYGDRFYLVPKGGLSSEVYQLDTLLENKQPLIMALKTTAVDGTILPLVAYQTLEVYINGYRLIEGLDYRCDPLLGNSNDVLQTLLTVSNQDYINLDEGGNILETVVHGDSVVSTDKGYVIENMLHRDEPPMVWSASCGRAYAHGLLVNNLREIGDTLISARPLDDGVPYLLEWSLPFSVKKLMQSLQAEPDIDLRTRIFKVLNLTKPVYPSIVSMFHLYALYSPYLASIITDVAMGVLTVIDEPKDDQFLKQFSNYTLLYSRDPVINDSEQRLDRRFVTLAAHYANFIVSDPEQMLLVQRLINLTLNPSPLSLEQVLI